MAKEVRSGAATVEAHIAPTLKSQFAKKVKKNKTSMAQVIRDHVQAYVKNK